ncbi:MAG: arsenic efflux protein [Clostridia bacterium]|nr:arsenic efflux protein [Clostridia bacterium]
MLHSVIHAAKDTLVILPILFLTYLVIEFVEHKAGEKAKKIISASGKAGPLLGGLIGLIPQCGFSGAAASLFAVGTVSTGTLIAVFLATSDEMLPILISASVPAKEVSIILLIKLVSGTLFGFITDALYRRKKSETIEHMCEEENCHCEHDGIFLSALKHTLKIVAIVFMVTCGLNIIIELIGEDKLQSLMITTPVVGELVAGLVGLIPNCSASVLLTDLYVENALSVGQLISGLCVNAGIGVIVLFKTNKNLKENLVLTAVLYVCGVITGIITNLIL